MYSDNEGKATSPKNKNELELVSMLAHMTKEVFIEAVNERRFVVQAKTDTKYEVFLISHNHDVGEFARFNLNRVINPGTKDGTFRQTGGGYNKAMSSIEDVAYYVDNNAEDRQSYSGTELSCKSYFMKKQNYNVI